MFLKRLRLTLEMIRFEHSVFALPFALTGALLAFREDGFASTHKAWIILWIVVAMVGARSAAMAFNRLVDAEIDAQNPRTKMRHLPAGLLSRKFSWGFTISSSLVFFLAAWELNPLCFHLAPLALGVVLTYSFTKRFTHFSHVVLGFALGIAPGRGLDCRTRFARSAHPLADRRGYRLDSVGSTIIYSLPGLRFPDSESELFSIPKVFGIAKALWIYQRFCTLG